MKNNNALPLQFPVVNPHSELRSRLDTILKNLAVSDKTLTKLDSSYYEIMGEILKVAKGQSELSTSQQFAIKLLFNERRLLMKEISDVEDLVKEIKKHVDGETGEVKPQVMNSSLPTL
ncbi:TPA: hypothetical protein ACMDQP_003111 [Vibrio cholerae]